MYYKTSVWDSVYAFFMKQAYDTEQWLNQTYAVLISFLRAKSAHHTKERCKILGVVNDNCY